MSYRVVRPLLAASALLCSAFAVHAQTADLLISEYIEGASFNKAIEIYNGTGAAVDLTTGQYRLELHVNGAAAASQSVALTGSLANGAVLVLCNSGAAADILANCDVQNNSVVNHNGDDAFVLRKASASIGNGTIVDSFGANTGDPGTSWGTGDFTTHDHTLRRKASVCTGDVVINNAVDPSVEWDSFALLVHGGLVGHTENCTPTVSINDISLDEGSAGPNNFQFTVTYTGPTIPPFSVDFATADGSAQDGSDVGEDDDYTATSGTLNFSGVSGQTQNVVVVVNGDAVDEPAQTFDVVLSNPTNGVVLHATNHTGTATLLNDDAPTVSIADVTQAEGSGGGTTTFTFTVSLNIPAGPAGVAFDIATAANTATGGGDDYTDNAVVAQSIPPGQTSATFAVSVDADDDIESTETFFVNVTNVVNAQIGDGQATGTIQNDDVDLIGEVQGNGAMSPRNAQQVTVGGIVTGKAAQGFWIQDAGDGDPATSDGIYVFCGANWTACGIATTAFDVGANVQVRGTVLEYIPTADPRQLPLTELTGNPVVTIIAAGPLALPAAVEISVAAGTAPTPAGGLGQLERFEGMRVTVPAMTVTGPTESDVFFGTATDASIPRPFREPGIDTHDHDFFDDTAANVPEWDANPENIRVKTRQMIGATNADFVNVSANEQITGLTGVLDYAFRSYTVLTLPGAQPAKVPGTVPPGTGVTARGSREVTVGSFNIEWLGTEATAGAPGTLAERLEKLKVVVRDRLHDPDILGLVEIKDQATVDALVAAINGYAGANGAGPVQYVGEMVTPDGAQNLAILWNEALLPNGEQRVESLGAATEPTEDGTPPELLCPAPANTPTGDPLHDRPPLVKQLRVAAPNGEALELAVVVTHMKALIGVDSTVAYAPASPFFCFGDEGTRNRAKRQQQSEDVAELVDTLEGANDENPVLLIGDFNAYTVNDGFVDIASVVSGITFPDDTTVQPGDGANLYDPDLFNITETAPAASSYSYVFDGSAQVIDQILANQAMIDATGSNPRVEFAHLNADYCNFCVSATGTELRSSDHEPVLGYFAIEGFGTPPAISAIGAQSTNEDTATTPIAFSVSDTEDGAALTCAAVTSGSSNQSVVADAGIAVSGAAQSCSVVVTPVGNASGTADITLEIADSDGDTATRTFTLTVNAVNDAPTISNVLDTSVAEDGNVTVDFTIADIDSAVTCANVTGTSGTPAVIANAGIVVSGAAQACSATLTPVANANGTSTIQLTVTDGQAPASDSFVLTVTPVNDTPSFAVAANNNSLEDAGAQTVPGFASSISAGAPNEAGQVLTFNVTGNTNAALFSVQPSISANGTLAYTSAPNANGQATITVTLSDDAGATSAPQTFTITVTTSQDAPVFTNEPYAFTVAAQSPAGTQVGTVSATDADGNALTFSINTSSNPGAVAIDPQTGAITVADPALLTQATSPLLLTVRVTDGNGGQDLANVTITVTEALPEHIFGDGFEGNDD